MSRRCRLFSGLKRNSVRKGTIDEKREVLKQVEGLSKRECERKLLEISPRTVPTERERPVTAELTELRLVLDSETMAMIAELKNRLSYAMPQASSGEVIKRALREMLARARDARTPKFPPAEVASMAEQRRRVFARAGERCEFVAQDGTRCAATGELEIDHVRPRSMGGTDDPSNLRVLCRAHNSFEACRILGKTKMQRYLPALANFNTSKSRELTWGRWIEGLSIMSM